MLCPIFDEISEDLSNQNKFNWFCQEKWTHFLQSEKIQKQIWRCYLMCTRSYISRTFKSCVFCSLLACVCNAALVKLVWIARMLCFNGTLLQYVFSKIQCLFNRLNAKWGEWKREYVNMNVKWKKSYFERFSAFSSAAFIHPYTQYNGPICVTHSVYSTFVEYIVRKRWLSADWIHCIVFLVLPFVWSFLKKMRASNMSVLFELVYFFYSADVKTED